MNDSAQAAACLAHAKHCFLRACALDVAVCKPGNVSAASPGHGMDASLFLASAHAAVQPLFDAGARVGPRIEGSMTATWAAARCNTNLGILLLCAPLAVAIEQPGALAGATQLRAALEAALAALDLDDTRCAYRAIALANPAGLGQADAEDVRHEPHLPLRAAMSLAAQRDSIARQYASGYADLFDPDLAPPPPGLLADLFDPALAPPNLGSLPGQTPPGARLSFATAAHVQQLYLHFMSRWPDSHIVRKHGWAVAHTVMSAAQAWALHPAPGADPAFAAWDEALKAQQVNPGTSADLTVARVFITLLLAGAAGQ